MRRTILTVVTLAMLLTGASTAEAQLPPDQTDDALGSRLFLGSTGRSLKRGEAYLAMDTLFLQTMQVGVTDRFSIGFISPYFFLVGGGLTPKFQIYRDDRTAIATGLIHLRIRATGTMDVTYISMTRGSEDDSLTLGAGRISPGFLSGDGAVMVLVGGEHRTGPRRKVVTENYISPAGLISMFGVRNMGRRISREGGMMLFVPFARSGVPPIPGFFYNVVVHTMPSRPGPSDRR